MSREADLRYSPLVKDLKDVMCFPGPEDIKKMSQDEKDILIKILDHYIETRPSN